jgi:hypothetical protein
MIVAKSSMVRLMLMLVVSAALAVTTVWATGGSNTVSCPDGSILTVGWNCPEACPNACLVFGEASCDCDGDICTATGLQTACPN